MLCTVPLCEQCDHFSGVNTVQPLVADPETQAKNLYGNIFSNPESIGPLDPPLSLIVPPQS